MCVSFSSVRLYDFARVQNELERVQNCCVTRTPRLSVAQHGRGLSSRAIENLLRIFKHSPLILKRKRSFSNSNCANERFGAALQANQQLDRSGRAGGRSLPAGCSSTGRCSRTITSTAEERDRVAVLFYYLWEMPCCQSIIPCLAGRAPAQFQKFLMFHFKIKLFQKTSLCGLGCKRFQIKISGGIPNCQCTTPESPPANPTPFHKFLMEHFEIKLFPKKLFIFRLIFFISDQYFGGICNSQSIIPLQGDIAPLQEAPFPLPPNTNMFSPNNLPTNLKHDLKTSAQRLNTPFNTFPC